MGTEVGLTFHRYTDADLIDLVVYEPCDAQFVWLSIYIHPRLRNGSFSIELMKYLLLKLEGVHHVHPLKSAKTFPKAAKLLKWKKQNDSIFFEDCHSYITQSHDWNSPIAPFLDEVLNYRTTIQLSKLKSFSSPHQLKLCILLIRDHFRSDVAKLF